MIFRRANRQPVGSRDFLIAHIDIKEYLFMNNTSDPIMCQQKSQ